MSLGEGYGSLHIGFIWVRQKGQDRSLKEKWHAKKQLFYHCTLPRPSSGFSMPHTPLPPPPPFSTLAWISLFHIASSQLLLPCYLCGQRSRQTWRGVVWALSTCLEIDKRSLFVILMFSFTNCCQLGLPYPCFQTWASVTISWKFQWCTDTAAPPLNSGMRPNNWHS